MVKCRTLLIILILMNSAILLGCPSTSDNRATTVTTSESTPLAQDNDPVPDPDPPAVTASTSWYEVAWADTKLDNYDFKNSVELPKDDQTKKPDKYIGSYTVSPSDGPTKEAIKEADETPDHKKTEKWRARHVYVRRNTDGTRDYYFQGKKDKKDDATGKDWLTLKRGVLLPHKKGSNNKPENDEFHVQPQSKKGLEMLAEAVRLSESNEKTEELASYYGHDLRITVYNGGGSQDVFFRAGPKPTLPADACGTTLYFIRDAGIQYNSQCGDPAVPFYTILPNQGAG